SAPRPTPPCSSCEIAWKKQPSKNPPAMLRTATNRRRDAPGGSATKYASSSRVFVVLLLLSASGCAAPRVIESRQPAHVIILPGIGGNDPLIGRLRSIIEHEIPGVSAQVWDWTAVEPRASVLNLNNLEDYPRNCRRARRLADQLIDWRSAHPDTKL